MNDITGRQEEERGLKRNPSLIQDLSETKIVDVYEIHSHVTHHEMVK